MAKDQSAGGVLQHFRFWGAVYFLIVLALIFNGVHAYYEIKHAEEELLRHGQAYTTYNGVADWIRTTAENMQSELWQIGLFQAVFLLAPKHQWFKADAEDMERLEGKVDELHRRLDEEIRYWKWITAGKKPEDL